MSTDEIRLDTRIPAELHPILLDYLERVRGELGERVSAAYLVGSVALDDYRPGRSDIDFVAVLNGRLIPGEFGRLAGIHRSITQQYPRGKLEGIYLYNWQLGIYDPWTENFPHYHDGKLEWSRRIPLAAVTWWILKRRGVRLFGPHLENLAIVLDRDALLAQQRENLNSYWSLWTWKPIRIAILLSDWGIEWAVLGVLRQFYTLHEEEITSKTRAGEYALAHLPEQFHAIVHEAIALRGGKKRGYRSRLKRAREALGLLKHVIRACNEG